MKLSSKAVFLFLGTCVVAQNVTVPNACTSGFTAGSDEVLYTVPYTYNQVLSIIGSYKNLTWSGNPDNTVTLNGSDNQVGTARTYDIDGAHVIETILLYSKPPAPGPYQEVHNTAQLQIPSANLSFYIPYDGTVLSSTCNGMASQFNFTAHFCASNATAGAAALHMLHMTDAVTVGQFLGGQNYTSCSALGSSTNSSMSGGATGTTSGMPAVYTGSAMGRHVLGLSALGAAVLAFLL